MQNVSWLRPSEALNRPLNRQAEEKIHTAAPPQIIRRLGFRVGNIGLLIGEHAISELTDIVSICPIPNTAAWLIGIINLRGNLIPVFDLNMLLGLERPPRKKYMLLILGQGSAGGAIMIDDLPVQITFSPTDKLNTLPPLPIVLQPFATSGFEKNQEIWLNFEHLGFFESLATRIAT